MIKIGMGPHFCKKESGAGVNNEGLILGAGGKGLKEGQEKIKIQLGYSTPGERIKEISNG